MKDVFFAKRLFAHNVDMCSFIYHFFVGFFIGIALFFILIKLFVLNTFLSSVDYIKNNGEKVRIFFNDRNYLTSSSKQFKVHGSGKIDIKLTKNNSLESILVYNGFSNKNINSIASVLQKKVNLRSLKEGQKFTVTYDFETILKEKNTKRIVRPIEKKNIETRTITSLSFKLQNGIRYAVEYNGGAYILHIEKPQLTIKTHIINGTIKNNLFTDAVVGGINATTLYNVLNEYAFLIDFQRDIHPNDKFVFVLKTVNDGDGDVIEEKVLYSNLVLRGHKHEMFDFHGSFYDRDGKSIQKKLLKTPVDGARITSGFQKKRKHPILGYTRAHKGIDMAVPTGTPIYSAGDGVVAEINLRHRQYGKYVLIRHNSEYSTKYAHMSRVALHLRVGQRVKQRQVIGYVGMTGLATGPHLHYEVIKRGQHINPRDVSVVETRRIAQNKMLEFKKIVVNIDRILKN